MRPSTKLACIVAACLLISPLPHASAADHMARKQSIGTFVSPVYVAAAPGDMHLLFVVEQRGMIQVLRDEQKLPDAFLDISGIVRGPPDPNGGGEQGLLSVAFPPDYASSRLFYVAFTKENKYLEVAEFRRDTNDPARAVRGSRRTVIIVPHPNAKNHNAGQLQFGPDGLLYISTGDGGGREPRGEPSRDLHDLRGKILRIDPRKAGSKPYTIPADNPFVGSGNREEIYAYGFRNPWRFSFDGKKIAIGDVGQESWEEINFLYAKDIAGVNFGWPQYEGNAVFDNSRPGAGPPKFPIHVYSHNGNRCAVVGGFVSHDPALPLLKGRYLYADFCTGQVRSFIPKVGAQVAEDDRAVGISVPGIGGFGEGHGGTLYIAQTTGEVSRIVPP